MWARRNHVIRTRDLANITKQVIMPAYENSAFARGSLIPDAAIVNCLFS
jgi:hypothetical protein